MTKVFSLSLLLGLNGKGFLSPSLLLGLNDKGFLAWAALAARMGKQAPAGSYFRPSTRYRSASILW
jgi:hypothetical protein